ncbi:MAG TPA: hypothetical protein VFR95_00250 [Gemmatimonadaceae bacterium]|nr:hypothetical protein [Gemmatimonadaceae bacterium]
MRIAVRGALAIVVVVMLWACGSGSGGAVRGAGLQPASFPPAKQAEIYAAAAGGSFDIGPSLILLVDRSMLPRDAGYGDGGELPDDVAKAMLRTSAFQGTCKPVPDRDPTRAPTCPVTDAGYSVRVSPIFQAAGDTLLVYEAADRYDTRKSGGHARFLMEEAYKLVPNGKSWRVATKARVHAP